MRYDELKDRVAVDNNKFGQYVLAVDLHGEIMYCNDAFQQLYQLQGISVAGISIEALFNHQEAGLIRNAIQQLMQPAAKSRELQFKYPGASQLRNTIQFSIQPIADKKGKMTGVLLKGDIKQHSADSKKTVTVTPAGRSVETGLVPANANHCFNELAEFMPDLMWMTNKQNEITHINKAWQQYCGTGKEEQLRDGWLKFIHPEDIEKVIAERKTAFVVQQPFNLVYRFKKHDGNFRWMNMKGNPVYDAQGVFLGYTGLCLDITAVKEAQIQIRRQQELMESTKIEFGKFTKIAQKIGSIIIMCNADNRITWVNDAFVKTTGYTLKEVSGKTPGSFLKGPETSKETLDRIRKVIEQGKGIRTEILYYTKSGARIWLDLMIESLFDKDGVITGYITIQKDITLKKISEKEVLEQMSHLKKISFITSHELRHEFSKILQLLQTAKFQDHNLATYAQIFSDIEYSANLMNDAIFKLNDQINFASSNSISLNKYLLNQAIEEICLVDDDHLVNKLNELIIRNVMPTMPVHTFDQVDTALQYVKENPNTKRKIFLDLNFSGRSGWDFLHEYEKLGHPWPVVILTSSIDHVDYERSKKFLNVTHFITKPLTIEQFEKLSEMEHLMVH